MTNYLKDALGPAKQTEPAAPNQVQNSAGGYTFALDDWGRLDRFLILGSEGGTYYASERKLTRENTQCVERCAKADGARLVARIVEISESGRAPKNDPAILALAIAAKLGDEHTRRLAHAAVPKVCRIGTHLYHFADFVNTLGGWGRMTTRAIGDWFNKKAPYALALQLMKYQSRDGWSARDLLRMSHPTAPTKEHNVLYKWATSGEFDEMLVDELDGLDGLAAFETLKRADNVKDVIKLVTVHRLPRECMPTQWLTKPEVWEALLPHMGLTAMIRNLGTMTKNGLIAPLAKATGDVCSRLADGDALKKSRVHPIQVLSALLTYRMGHGVRGNSTWVPVQPIIDALDGAFYKAFGNIVPTGKPTLLALDVSGSMGSGNIAGVPGLTPRVGAAAMCLVTAAVESNYHIMGFAHTFRDLGISPNMRLDDVCHKIHHADFGRTDCSLPFLWAQRNARSCEAFAVYTDNETYAGNVHPHIALADFRQATGKNARSVVVGFTSTGFSVADPSDTGMLDCVGFDSSAPTIIADFFRGGAATSVHTDEDTSED